MSTFFILKRYARVWIVGIVFVILLWNLRHVQNISLPEFLYQDAPRRTNTPLPLQATEWTELSTKQEIERKERQMIIRDAFVHAYTGYQTEAWGHDEVHPVSGGFNDVFCGWAATLIDSLDTLWIMGFNKEFMDAIETVRRINFKTPRCKELNVFETNIRYLGGLLSAYDLSGHRYYVLLSAAKDIGDFLLKAFDTQSGWPITRWDWNATHTEKLKAGEMVFLAEIGSFSLEFLRLSQLTKDGRYYQAAQRIDKALMQIQDKTVLPGLWPAIVNAHTREFTHPLYSLGAWADSFYEYLPKQFMLLNGQPSYHLDMYAGVAKAAKQHMFFKPMISEPWDILFTSPVNALNDGGISRTAQVEHLSCFVGGMIGVGSKLLNQSEDMKTAIQLTDGCVWAYERTTTGIMPEKFTVIPCPDQENCHWNQTLWDLTTNPDHPGEVVNSVVLEQRLPAGMAKINDGRYLLRPEAIESVFYMYRLTGDESWREKGWKMFKAIERHCKTNLAYSAIDDVTLIAPGKLDKMESFFLAETLKYFYLLFSPPDIISLDKYVLNTEAHPFAKKYS